MKEDNQMFYFRVKTEFMRESENGELKKTKLEELVYASNYTEAEATALIIIDSYNRREFGDVTYDIQKTKINDIQYNPILQAQSELVNGLMENYFNESAESGVGLYSVKCIYLYADEKTGKEKNVTEVIYVPAESNADATNRVNKYLKTCGADYVIRDTKFDKVEAIYWPVNIYREKVAQYNNRQC